MLAFAVGLACIAAGGFAIEAYNSIVARLWPAPLFVPPRLQYITKFYKDNSVHYAYVIGITPPADSTVTAYSVVPTVNGVVGNPLALTAISPAPASGPTETVTLDLSLGDKFSVDVVATGLKGLTSTSPVLSGAVDGNDAAGNPLPPLAAPTPVLMSISKVA